MTLKDQLYRQTSETRGDCYCSLS